MVEDNAVRRVVADARYMAREPGRKLDVLSLAVLAHAPDAHGAADLAVAERDVLRARPTPLASRWVLITRRADFHHIHRAAVAVDGCAVAVHRHAGRLCALEDEAFGDDMAAGERQRTVDVYLGGRCC